MLILRLSPTQHSINDQTLSASRYVVKEHLLQYFNYRIYPIVFQEKSIGVDIYFEELYKNFMNLLSTNEAAVRLNISQNRVLVLIAEGRLPAKKIGRDYVIQETDLKLVAYRPPGRPRKNASTAEPSKPASKRTVKK